MVEELKPYVIMERSDCPVCGSTKLAVKARVDAAIEKGDMPKDTTACLALMATIIASQKQVIAIPKMVEGVQAITDVCEECGTIFARKLQVMPARLDPMPLGNQMPRGLNSPGM